MKGNKQENFHSNGSSGPAEQLEQKYREITAKYERVQRELESKTQELKDAYIRLDYGQLIAEVDSRAVGKWDAEHWEQVEKERDELYLENAYNLERIRQLEGEMMVYKAETQEYTQKQEQMAKENRHLKTTNETAKKSIEQMVVEKQQLEHQVEALSVRVAEQQRRLDKLEQETHRVCKDNAGLRRRVEACRTKQEEHSLDKIYEKYMELKVKYGDLKTKYGEISRVLENMNKIMVESETTDHPKLEPRGHSSKDLDSNGSNVSETRLSILDQLRINNENILRALQDPQRSTGSELEKIKDWIESEHHDLKSLIRQLRDPESSQDHTELQEQTTY